jgi:hypothetical protein
MDSTKQPEPKLITRVLTGWHVPMPPPGSEDRERPMVIVSREARAFMGRAEK